MADAQVLDANSISVADIIAQAGLQAPPPATASTGGMGAGGVNSFTDRLVATLKAPLQSYKLPANVAAEQTATKDLASKVSADAKQSVLEMNKINDISNSVAATTLQSLKATGATADALTSQVSAVFDTAEQIRNSAMKDVNETMYDAAQRRLELAPQIKAGYQEVSRLRQATGITGWLDRMFNESSTVDKTNAIVNEFNQLGQLETAVVAGQNDYADHAIATLPTFTPEMRAEQSKLMQLENERQQLTVVNANLADRVQHFNNVRAANTQALGATAAISEIDTAEYYKKFQAANEAIKWNASTADNLNRLYEAGSLVGWESPNFYRDVEEFMGWPVGGGKQLMPQLAKNNPAGASAIMEAVASGTPSDPIALAGVIASSRRTPANIAIHTEATALLDNFSKFPAWSVKVAKELGLTPAGITTEEYHKLPLPERRRLMEKFQEDYPIPPAFLAGKSSTEAISKNSLMSDVSIPAVIGSDNKVYKEAKTIRVEDTGLVGKMLATYKGDMQSALDTVAITQVTQERRPVETVAREVVAFAKNATNAYNLTRGQQRLKAGLQPVAALEVSVKTPNWFMGAGEESVDLLSYPAVVAYLQRASTAEAVREFTGASEAARARQTTELTFPDIGGTK